MITINVQACIVERPDTLEALIDESKKRDMPVHRLIRIVVGSTLLTRAELKKLSSES